MEGYRGIIFKPEYKKVNKSNRWTGTLILRGLALITRILLYFAAENPVLVEKFYSSTIYPFIARGLGLLSSFVPFSIAEGLLILIPILILIALFTIFTKPKLIINNIQGIIQYVVKILAIIYILFYVLWGFNYYRQDYLVIANMKEEATTYNELKELSLEIIKKTSLARETLLEDSNGIFIIQESFDILGKMANEGFDGYIVGNINLGGNFARIKPVFLSRYMSYTGITGIYIPFTSEPTINVDIPDHNLLSTITHEIAHQRGFAKEEEANFIAYKANINNSDERFQYSGYYLAMQYLMNEVYRENPDDYFLLYSELSDAVKRDMGFTREYWASKEGKVEKAVTTMNDNYLKANNQVDGVRSYSGVVRLLLAEYKNQK